ncbi:hypothetical protein UCDDA912_g10130 [Diaporthe ampelina]|uniref:Uncharacterized protein n=1 Tax=Diaporthe ampelina TaxID=1214573 RepID=A0A0G2F6X0_9PEZI|nr:hypothetical protein UCDDA912_g10130 [Diaporthe ampelina]
MSQPNTPSSISSVSSFQSFLSSDSYLEKLKPVDAGFAEMMKEVKALDTKRSMIAERKVQSHIQKRRDQTDVATRENWTGKQIGDYASYKALVKSLADANRKATASRNIAKAQDDEESCKKALADQKARSTAAIRAAEARLGFMTKYPNAYSTSSHSNHIKAVEDNLNSAKLAQREVQKQLNRLALVTKQR